MKKGFTLLELIVVIIIIGILATLGFIQYTKVIEKGRKAEARANLGTLRQLEMARYEDPAAGAYGDLASLSTGLPDTASACNTSYYFSYACNSSNGSCTATRCTSGGKSPNVAATDAYTITLSVGGAFSGTGSWQ